MSAREVSQTIDIDPAFLELVPQTAACETELIGDQLHEVSECWDC